MSFSDDDDFADGGPAGPGCNMGDFAGGFSDDEDDERSEQSVPMGAPSGGGAGSGASREADGTMSVQTLSGEQRVPAAIDVSAAERGDIEEVTVTYKLTATPSELASGKAPRLELADNAFGVFDEAPDASSRSKHHVLYKAEVTHVRNEFPFDLGLTVDCSSCEGLKSVGKVVVPSDSGKPVKANALIQAGEVTTYGAQGSAQPLIEGNGSRFDQNEFSKKYPTYNLGNLREPLQTIKDPAFGYKTMIPYAHPATDFYNRVRVEGGMAPISSDDFAPGTQLYTASAEDTETVMGLIETELMKGTCDLYKIGFDLSRVHGNVRAGASAPDFDDSTEMTHKFASAASASATLNQSKMLTFSVKYKFRHS